jgi:hypothetical protein
VTDFDITRVFDDPVARIWRYLSAYYPGAVEREKEPDGYTGEGLLILLYDAGGPGAHHHVLSDERVLIEVRHHDQDTASATAREVDALVRDWHNREHGIYNPHPVARPEWSPEGEARIPAYVQTVEFTTRGRPLTK